jgi:transposase-like protein
MAQSLGEGGSIFAFPPEVRKVIYTTNASISYRRSSEQADLVGATKHHRRMESLCPSLEIGDESVCHHLWRSVQQS